MNEMRKKQSEIIFKLDFSQFSGKNLIEQLYKMKHNFRLDKTNQELNVKRTMIRKLGGGSLEWEEQVESLEIIFKEAYQDLLVKLITLRQEEMLQKYFQ